MTRITSRDVARRASVSIATVSRVLNHVGNVSPEVQDKVLRAAADLDYQPSRAAQRLRARRSQVIGLVISDIQNPFFTSVVRGIEDYAQLHGYSVVLCNSDEDAQKEQLYLNVLRAEGVAGVILTPTFESTTHLQMLIENNIPVVALDRLVREFEVDSVFTDNLQGARDAVAHLISQGHRRIGFIGLPLTISPGIERHEGYLAALAAQGIPIAPALITIGDAKLEGGYACARQLLTVTPRPTALFAANNLMTLGALTALRERGLRVPTECSLIGFDDMPWSPLLDPPLTCVAQPAYELGTRAAELLIRRSNAPSAPIQHAQLAPRLVLRESVAPPLSQIDG